MVRVIAETFLASYGRGLCRNFSDSDSQIVSGSGFTSRTRPAAPNELDAGRLERLPCQSHRGPLLPRPRCRDRSTWRLEATVVRIHDEVSALQAGSRW